MAFNCLRARFMRPQIFRPFAKLLRQVATIFDSFLRLLAQARHSPPLILILFQEGMVQWNRKD